MRITLPFLAGFIGIALAVPKYMGRKSVIHERLESPQWVKRGRVSPDTLLPVRVALKQTNLEKGTDYLMEVSDPSSPSYGNHYAQEQVVELFAPSDESIEKVKEWLISSGLPESSLVMSRSKGWISFDATAFQLGSVLQTRYHVYHHVASKDDHVGTSEYLLPEHISPLVDFISPGVAPILKRGAHKQERGPLGNPGGPHSNIFATETVDHKALKALHSSSMCAEELDNCSSIQSPQCIRAMYNIPLPGSHADPRNHMGIYQAAGQTYAQADLDTFFKLGAPEIPKGTHPKANLIGKGAMAEGPVAKAGVEATLDYDMAYPLVYPQVIEDFQVVTTGHDFFDRFLDAIDGSFCHYAAYGQTGDDPGIDGSTAGHQCGTFRPTNVLSISYGYHETGFPVRYIKRQCNEFMKLGLQGISVFVASGDTGVTAPSVGCLGTNKDIFVANGPSGCPFVTSVGSTVLPPGSRPGDEETASTGFASGGGFSNIFPRPDYQRHALDRYFTSHRPGFNNYTTSDGVIPKNPGVYNGAGRGYPDLSAVGERGLVVFQGSANVGYGTSMSAPIVASLFNRINEERLRAGKKPVGFVNPTLYKYQDMFHDITKGDMKPNGLCNGKGFSCARGWDPVTGMGTPKYDKMLEIFLRQ